MKTDYSSPPRIFARSRAIARPVTTAILGALAGGIAAQASTDYAPAVWYPVCDGKWNTSGYGKRFYVIHDMEGYYASGRAYIAKCGVSVSVHYAINGKKDATSDFAAGHISQMVRDAYYSWTARCWNGYSMQTEHEGFASNPAWYTDAMYNASGTLVRSKCNKYGIAKDRNHVIGHDQKKISAWRTWAAGQGYSSTWINCNTHSDPGPYWAWTKFMDIIKGTASVPASPSGLAATVISTSQINLAWADNSNNETGFKVERATASAGPFSQIATVGAGVKTYGSTGLASGTTYWYRVRAYNASGNSGYSNTASGTTKDTIPAAPTSLAAASASDTQINLTWAQTMPNEDGFRIYRSTDNVTFTLVATVGINVVSYNNTGLAGNTLYYYKVAAYNTAGNSAFSNTASATTGPQAPSGLVVNAVSGTANWNKLALSWTDNANAEVGFKIERGTALAGPFSQIATNAAGVTTYTDSGLAASTTYYYRVRSYNANGNSAYSAVASRATPNAPPILTAIGNKTVLPGQQLSFTVTASDPNAPAPATTTWQNFTSFPHNTPNETILFKRPSNSGTTSSFLDTSTNYTRVVTNGPSAWGSGNKSMVAGWGFKTGTANYWVRLNTFNTATNPNPTIALDQRVQFKFYATKAVKVGLGIRETGTAAAYGANGGTTGALEWVGVTNVTSGHPIPDRLVAAVTPVTLNWNIPFEAQWSFTGDGIVDQSGAKGVLEHLIIRGEGGTGAYSVFFDDMQVVVQNNLVYTLDAGAPAGATIGRRTGKFSWTPGAGLSGDFPVTIRVTDNLGGQDFETVIVSVLGTGNAAPVLNAIGNKTVNEGSTLAFTATATEYNPGQTLTYSLDAGNPVGSSINASSGAFSWTPTEAQGPGSYPITIRVTDNGSPVSNDFETITVTVNEANAAPVLAAIANQTITEGGALATTASATDSDTPAQTITYSITGPAGISINPSSGAISWTSDEEDGGQTYQIVVTATDNGVPVLKGTKSFNVTIAEANTAPTIAIGAMNDVNPFAQFDELDDESIEGHNNAVLFRVPYFSASTTQFLDSTSYSFVTNVFPQSAVNSSYQALYVNMNFKTGTVNPWCRLTTHTSSAWTNTFAYPNPTIDLGQHVRFKIWSDRSIKVAIGVRETGTLNPLGFDGGITGTIEWVGATASGGSPVPTRTITASNWTQLDFNLPAETIAALSGNGVLASGKGVLEELAIVPNAGSGFYNIYLDDFETSIIKTTNSIAIDKGDTLTLACSASDVDQPAQDLSFSLGAGAPTNATISDAGVFSWKPDSDQSPSTNVITLMVTDNGTPALSGSQNITVVVNNINTPPRIEKMQDILVENNAGTTVTFDAAAQDDDLPAQTLTYSIVSGPGSITSGGAYSWTPPAGNSTNSVLIRVTDNGSPALFDEQTVTIIVVSPNTAPALSLGTARATEPVITFETFTNGTPSEQVLFKKPANSSTTSSFVDTAVTNYTTVTTAFPAGNANAGAKTLRATWTFKTGTANYWVRLNTLNTTLLPNPAINASARLKFDVYTTKALKVGLGIRETGTSADNGANGGTTGNIEYVGCNSMIGSTPQPTRTVNASTWTTLEFDLPSEPCQALTGNGVLAGGQQVLEHLVLVGAGGTGAYDVYFDNFQVVTTTALPGTVTMKANSTLTFTASAADPDPGAGIGYGLDADFSEVHTNAVLNGTNGVFTWTPGTGVAGTTNTIEVTAEDSPTNGGIPKSDTETFTVIVNSDSLAPQSVEGGTFVAGGDAVTLSWDSVAGASYAVQSRSAQGGDWSTTQTVTATGDLSSLAVSSSTDSYFRVVEISGSASE